MFLNKNVHEQVSILNTTLMNTFANYAPNKYITVDDKDPPWMKEAIKTKINSKKSLSKSKNFIQLQNLAIDISELISVRKEEYMIISQRNLMTLTQVLKPTGQF